MIFGKKEPVNLFKPTILMPVHGSISFSRAGFSEDNINNKVLKVSDSLSDLRKSIELINETVGNELKNIYANRGFKNKKKEFIKNIINFVFGASNEATQEIGPENTKSKTTKFKLNRSN